MDYFGNFNFTAEAVRVAKLSAKQKCLKLVLGEINTGVHLYLVKPILDINK